MELKRPVKVYIAEKFIVALRKQAEAEHRTVSGQAELIFAEWFRTRKERK